MLQYVLKRVLLSLVTLWLLVTILFLMVSLLPTNIGRAILGNTAPQVAVDNFNKEFGLNDSLIVQYGRLIKSLFTFDFGYIILHSSSFANAFTAVARCISGEKSGSHAGLT